MPEAPPTPSLPTKTAEQLTDLVADHIEAVEAGSDPRATALTTALVDIDQRWIARDFDDPASIRAAFDAAQESSFVASAMRQAVLQRHPFLARSQDWPGEPELHAAVREARGRTSSLAENSAVELESAVADPRSAAGEVVRLIRPFAERPAPERGPGWVVEYLDICDKVEQRHRRLEAKAQEPTSAAAETHLTPAEQETSTVSTADAATDDARQGAPARPAGGHRVTGSPGTPPARPPQHPYGRVASGSRSRASATSS